MNFKKISVVIAVILLSGLFWFLQSKLQHKKDTVVASTALPSNDNEKIIVNPDSHQIQIVTASGVKKEFLPGMRPSSVEIRKDGQVIVTSAQWGVEHGLCFGGGFSADGLRIGGGLDLLYFRKIDVGFLVTDLTKDLTKPRIGVYLSYTVWHETRLTVGIDHTGAPEVLITERF